MHLFNSGAFSCDFSNISAKKALDDIFDIYTTLPLPNTLAGGSSPTSLMNHNNTPLPTL
jgi:hypothetical protein